MRRKTAVYKISEAPCKKCDTFERYSNGNCVRCLLNRESDKQKDPEFAERKRLREMSRYQSDIEVARAKQKASRDRNKETISASRKLIYATRPGVREKAIAYNLADRIKNPGKLKARWASYYVRNRATRIANIKAWRLRQPEAYKDKVRAYSKAHYKRFPEMYYLKSLKRRGYGSLATPSWVNWDKMLALKAEADRLSLETGIKYSLDHVVPLLGVNKAQVHVVCGLNWEGNIQLMPLTDNKKKSNKYYVND